MILLDALAVIALARDELGADVVADALEQDDGAVTVVDVAEVLEREVRSGGDPDDRLADLRGTFRIEPVTEADALVVARLWPTTRRSALSLGDRFALGAAHRLGVPVYTAEHAWREPGEALGVEVRVIR